MRGVEIWVKAGVVLQDFNWPLRCLPLTFERGEVWITVFQPKTIDMVIDWHASTASSPNSCV